ncbi:hypothetical protein HELRODRAFT_164698 [Helobdella robusta]|uniref:Uncharacterized protein n=1 Tax=Helobdella robusta TaxID=6412 RepID=T1EVQ7_HELRO|nr:hypothetical protein HELRODRAFT_164698 [Helobdella robusta]ESN92622.1 hypothetical protein HELRODRAFT_164698 [Helobdella robusta]
MKLLAASFLLVICTNWAFDVRRYPTKYKELNKPQQQQPANDNSRYAHGYGKRTNPLLAPSTRMTSHEGWHADGGTTTEDTHTVTESGPVHSWPHQRFQQTFYQGSTVSSFRAIDTNEIENRQIL